MNDIPAHWGVAATLIWIATRDIERCRVDEDDALEVAYVLAHYQIATGQQAREIDDLSRELLTKLECGALTAYGRDYIEIPSNAWIKRNPAPGGQSSPHLYDGIVFSWSAIQRIWPAPSGRKRGPKPGGNSNKEQWCECAQELLKSGEYLKPNGTTNITKLATAVRDKTGSVAQPDTIAKTISSVARQSVR